LRPKIYLALTDDWELRGNGSGDVEEIQLRPMRELVRLYDAHGARGTFNVEVMQQLAFRAREREHAELKARADAWDEHVRATYERGHDVQLHIHPQWSDAAYEDGRWKLRGDWSILNYEEGEAHGMLAAGKEYLENLLRPVDPEYRCVAFRAGASCIAPSPFILRVLARLGLVFDMSIVGGMRIHTRNLRIDYTDCEESLVPFYPRMTDARRVSDKPEPIVCVPIFHFRTSRRRAAAQIASKVAGKALQKLRPASKGDDLESYARQEWADISETSALARAYEKAIKPWLFGRQETADVGALDSPSLKEMLRSIRRRAASSGLAALPVILTNHSKYMRDFAPLEEFLRDAAADDHVEFVTLADIARKLRAGEFPVRTSAR
jgi:hypothetical protein